MVENSVLAVSGYLPLLRFSRKSARAELRWSGLGGSGRGSRSVAGWDEDALTMAVEASRNAIRSGSPDGVVFASTSSPFLDRSMAGVVVDALQLSSNVMTQDVGGSRRAGTSALLKALKLGAKELITAGENRSAAAGSAQHLAFGDGAGAALTGKGKGIARLLGSAVVNTDFLDIYTSVERGLPYEAEARFIRDEAVAIYSQAISAAIEDAGIASADITLAVIPEPARGTYRAVAKKLALDAPNLCEEISEKVGDLGSAMPLFGLALAIDRAKPGDRLLIAGFGNGCDALILEVTGRGDGTATNALQHGAEFQSYTRLLSLTGMISLEWGARAEVNQKVSASTLLRHGRDMHGFVAGRDKGGNVQFPKTPIPVRPDATGPEPYEDVILCDVPAKVVSITADRLNFTPDPPFCFGLVQFENGARVAMEHCDAEGSALEVGDDLRMRFRIKAIDRQRKFRSYFWKAAPLKRPNLSEET